MNPPQDVADGPCGQCLDSLKYIAVNAKPMDGNAYRIGRHARVLRELWDTEGLPWFG